MNDTWCTELTGKDRRQMNVSFLSFFLCGTTLMENVPLLWSNSSSLKWSVSCDFLEAVLSVFVVVCVRDGCQKLPCGYLHVCTCSPV